MPRTAAPISGAALSLFQLRLLSWYRREKRDLDWRRTRDPYSIWISEIMLQQTRVTAVLPYYRRFLARFPTTQRLARARIDAVLRHWAGLGYYSRARNLHRAAQEMVARHGGQFPPDFDAALALPGIGRYTAAAVLSIAYGRPHAVLDGNVARVLARMGAVRGHLRAPHTWKRLSETADALLAARAPGDWNQAMMELGATVCTPQNPRCTECPVARWCQARAQGLAEQIPVPPTKPKSQHLTLAAAVLLDPKARTLLVRQNDPDAALFSRMWQFPGLRAGRNPRKDLAKYLARAFAIDAAGLERLDGTRHTVTFRQVRLAPFLLRVAQLPQVDGAHTLKLAELHRLPVSAATKKIAAAALATV